VQTFGWYLGRDLVLLQNNSSDPPLRPCRVYLHDAACCPYSSPLPVYLGPPHGLYLPLHVFILCVVGCPFVIIMQVAPRCAPRTIVCLFWDSEFLPNNYRRALCIYHANYTSNPCQALTILLFWCSLILNQTSHHLPMCSLTVQHASLFSE
jgi:hypothetical protein